MNPESNQDWGPAWCDLCDSSTLCGSAAAHGGKPPAYRQLLRS